METAEFHRDWGSDLRFTKEQRSLLEAMRWKWGAYALCKGDVLFTQDMDGMPKDARKAREDHCREICNTCPVRINCLIHSLKFPEESEFWGGNSKRERSRLRVERTKWEAEVVTHR